MPLLFGNAEPSQRLLRFVLAGMSIKPPRAHADDDDTEARVRIGFKIAPVQLNLDGRNRNLVGLGSYLVNAAGDCNGCLTSGGPPNFNYAPGENPYFGQKAVVSEGRVGALVYRWASSFGAHVSLLRFHGEMCA